ncbi:HIT domain-containing protein [Demequina sp. TTPB684]|uniref:HIT domain-containing protein n=1 Tax=unclassified Demequina TaxID=2620311 RepID=UPI001CF1141F|nr:MULTISPECIES: HIT domain-containing protein [unclassified Demequina]MCB2413313.1 HIT domain-containing protein [Demequina sp. TTPB684]UPU88968.1 HIT domain-containing protein [Demequina sp. TMPB413]
MTDCLFCRIAAGEIPADVVARTDTVIAFRDIQPKAPTHVLVVPVVHLKNVTDLAAERPELLAEMIEVAQQVADAETDGQFRLVFNTGPQAGQTVFHVHGHVLGGGDLKWENA